jgi:MerR family transcriptional regulator, light-induced transcriptional regulator
MRPAAAEARRVTESGACYRIGELSRRVGVTQDLLRAWERRYRLLEPVRTDAGYRLYTAGDERRVRRMQALFRDGLSAAEAARAARIPDPPAAPADSGAEPSRADALAAALVSMDEAAAQRELDAVFTELTLDTALREVVLPCRRRIGDGWARGEVSVAQEHFASQVLRGRLLGLARGWGRGEGTRLVLACPPGERHDLALLAFGIVLARRGWAPTFLGADSPIAAIGESVTRTGAAGAVVAATSPERFSDAAAELAALARSTKLYLAGPGADDQLTARLGAHRLDGDPVTAADTIRL